MKRYTQEEFDKFGKDEYGYKICPSGDYTLIRYFDEMCRFGKGCRFGGWCKFGEVCRFGEGCSFGERCSFGEECSFDEGCSFGEECSFGLFNKFAQPIFENENSCFFSRPVRSLKECKQKQEKKEDSEVQDG